MVLQTIDYMDAAEILYPDHQLHFQFDWSSGHSKRSDDGLSVGNMNWGFGGKQTLLRPTVLTADCIGPYPTTVNIGGQVVDYGVKAGETQVFGYGVSAAGQPPPLPPFNKLDAPRQDAPNRNGKEGSITEGFEGKCKGMAQVLFETGWWKPSVDGKPVMLAKMPAACKITGRNRKDDSPLPSPDTVGSIVLAARADFAAEMSELQKVCHNRQFYANILIPRHTTHAEPDPHPTMAVKLSSGRSCSRAHLEDEPEVPSRARRPRDPVLLGRRQDVLPAEQRPRAC
jgi:hypothetical protein